MEITIGLGILVVLITIVIFKLKQQRYTREGVPIVGNIPWLGCGIALNQGGGFFIKEVWKKYGDIFQLYAGGKKFTFIQNEKFLSYFYKGAENEIAFFAGLMDKDSSFQLDLILDPIGESKEEQEEYLSIKGLRNYLHQYHNEFVEKFIATNFQFLFAFSLKQQKIQNKNKFKIEILQLMLNFAGGFGTNFTAGSSVSTNEKFIENLSHLQNNALKVISKPSFANKSDLKATAEARNFLRSTIKKAFEDKTISELGDILLNLTYQSTGKNYSLDASCHSIFGFIFATIANTHASATHLLVQILTDPLVKQKVDEEIRRVIRLDPLNVNEKDPDRFVINQSMVDQLNYLGNCVTETLRLYSPPIHVRKAMVDIFSDDQILLAPKGSLLCISPFIRHRDERIYERANEFNPDRFLQPNKTKFSFLTFGQGRHYCLGKSLAESIIKFTISKLLLTYDIQLLEDKTSTHCANPKIQWVSFGVVLPAVPVYANFTLRNDE